MSQEGLEPGTQTPSWALPWSLPPIVPDCFRVAQTEPHIITQNVGLLRGVMPASIWMINEGKMKLPSTQEVRHPAAAT